MTYGVTRTQLFKLNYNKIKFADSFFLYRLNSFSIKLDIITEYDLCHNCSDSYKGLTHFICKSAAFYGNQSTSHCLNVHPDLRRYTMSAGHTVLKNIWIWTVIEILSLANLPIILSALLLSDQLCSMPPHIDIYLEIWLQFSSCQQYWSWKVYRACVGYL